MEGMNIPPLKRLHEFDLVILRKIIDKCLLAKLREAIYI
jgi:hypothetical protein